MQPGTVLARRYRIERLLGTGGTGSTYVARDLMGSAELAIKLLRLGSPELLRQFRGEFARLCGVYHPRLVEVRDFVIDLEPERHGEQERTQTAPLYFYTAALVRGRSLAAFARQAAWADVRRVVVDALEALGLLHALDIAHGDFKPDNVLVDEGRRGKLIDLSCSRPLQSGLQTVVVAGTRGFIAPELMEGRAADARADLYAVGATLAELGRGKAVPAAVTRLIERLTGPPESRPSDVNEVIELLGETPTPHGAPGGIAPRIVGRDAELTLGRAIIDRFVDEQSGPRVLCAVGPRGIGKTRMLQELKWEAELKCATSELSRASSDPIASLLRCAGAHPPGPGSLETVVEAAARLSAGPGLSVLVLDDWESLPEAQRFLASALLRSVTLDGKLLVLCTSRAAPDLGFGPELVRVLALEPLSEAAIAAWTVPTLAPSHVAALAHLTGGYPAYIEWCLARSSGGRGEAWELGGPSLPIEGPSLPIGDRVIAELIRRAQTPPQQRVLGLLAAQGGELDHDRWKAELSDDALEWLRREGWVRSIDGVLRLVRGADALALARALPPEVLAAAHAEIAERCLAELGDRATAGDWGRVLQHLVSAGRVAEAELCFDRAELSGRPDRGELAPYLGALAKASTSRSTLIRVAAHALAGAEPRAALGVLARLRRMPPAARSDGSVDDDRARMYALAAQCNLRLGKVRAVERHASRAERVARTDEQRAELADIRARALIHAGLYQRARELALPWLQRPIGASLEARLREDVGVTASFLGESDVARRELAAAVALQQRSGTARDLARALSYQGIVEFRDGHLSKAGIAQRQALDVSEREELTDMIANTCLNWAATCQQLGDLGGALQGFERGLELARALGRTNTVITLEYNLANIYADIGSFDRARDAARRAAERATHAGLRHVDGALAVLEGELSSLEQHWPRARDSFARARTIYVDLSASRELAEVDLALAMVALGQSDLHGAEAQLGAVEARVAALGAVDLGVRTQLARGRLQAAKGDSPAALATLEQALSDVGRTEQRPLEAEVEGALALALDRENRLESARQHRLKARHLWDRIGASLPQRMMDAFWRHPRRAEVAESHAVSLQAAGAVPSRELSRIMAINRRLNSTLSVRQVLDATIDAAIELTGAERGFVLLQREGAEGFEVAVMQNLDHSRLTSEQMLFSRGIAERVIRSEQPILATDAGTDDRFTDNVSVHAIKLKSVACVPILCRGETMGALYLDNRMVRGRFRDTDVHVLMAFAEQAALALSNARLHAALEQRTRQLEQEKRNVERLLRTQQRTIEHLTIAIDSRQQLLENRYAYEGIAGRGEAMRKVLDVLDRVIASDVTVLVQGESGTGKELVARAIHFNSPRAKEAFVGINCGSLSESLLESELFGHVRGAFTGATDDKKGLFVQAHRGTLFLDEVGEMTLPLQVKLLRALQEREVRAVGATSTTPFDVRLVSATNRDLKAEVERGRFREDLYYRMSVVDVTVPPLRERIEDLPEIARVILHRLADRQQRSAPLLSAEALRALSAHAWPGNVRELENVLTRAYVLLDGDTLRASDIVLPRARQPSRSTRSRRDYERDEAQRILAALRNTRWNISEVSRTLGIPRNTLYRKIKRYDLEVQRG